MTTPVSLPAAELSLGEQLQDLIRQLPDDGISLGGLLDVFGDEGLLLLTAMMVLVFLVPVSIPGVSTVFGAAILMVGIFPGGVIGVAHEAVAGLGTPPPEMQVHTHHAVAKEK